MTDIQKINQDMTSLQKVNQIISNSLNLVAARETLMKKLRLDNVQAETILGGRWRDRDQSQLVQLLKLNEYQRERIAEFRLQNPEYADAPEEWVKELV